jgi:predicted Rossmann fold nucleotide-binding protein DprA/Smf involved in DNA uptake
MDHAPLKDTQNMVVTLSADDLTPHRQGGSSGAYVAPATVAAMGNLDILQQTKLALFCSIKCPGSVILQTYDCMKALRDRGVTVIGGFHSPMERECLNILLRGTQPVIVCPARSLDAMRIKPEFRKPLEEGRLLFLSPFLPKESRISAQRAGIRNRFVAALADAILVAYATTDGSTEQLCHEILSLTKPAYTLDTKHNASLKDMGFEIFSETTLDTRRGCRDVF